MRYGFGSSIVLLAATAICRADAGPSLVETPDGKPPKGAIVLFDGGTTNLFLAKSGDPCDWPVRDGALVVSPDRANSRHIVSKLHFRDAQIHAEFMLPGGDRPRGAINSGLYIHGHYELQILNSFGKKAPTMEDCGAIYGISPPLVNACGKPGQWQTYDILFIAPRRDQAGKITRPGSITAKLNGQLVQDNTRIDEPVSVYHPLRYRTTAYTGRIKRSLAATGAGPLFLQDHGSPVRFRNVWVLPLDDKADVFSATETGIAGAQSADK